MLSNNGDTYRKGAASTLRAKWWKRSLTKWQIKVLLTIGGLLIVSSILIYTHNIVGQLVVREQKLVKLYADIIQSFTQPGPGRSSLDFFFLRDSVTPAINFPVILTDDKDEAVEPYDQFSLNLELDSTWVPARKKAYVQDYIQTMKSTYKGLEIKDTDGKVINKVFYTNSVLVTRLRYLPYIEILIGAVFIGIGYLSFSHLRRTEESNIWVGMAKEAAHQLGTPLSSLLAWIEILRFEESEQKRAETLEEMSNDVERLKIIANRFSLIGSKPKLEALNVNEVVEDVSTYFERRLPQLARHVRITRQYESKAICQLNRELFSWVLENLFKNAIEAIESKNGLIEVRLSLDERKSLALLEVQDNGKGMSNSVRKQIFMPGYTTKARGWGLGLSLSQRIVEEYHQGKIIVKHSEPGAGTSFLISLPLSIQS